MRAIQKMIPTAVDVAKEYLYEKSTLPEKAIPTEFNGYISSFGASIISAGLLPSIIFYSQKGDSEADRHVIITCLEQILRKHGYPADFKLVKKINEWTKTEDKPSIDRLTDQIMAASVALKLAIRIFPKSKKSNK